MRNKLSLAGVWDVARSPVAFGLRGLPPVGVALALGGCCTSPREPSWLDKHGAAVEAVQTAVDDFGTVSMSPPMIARPDDNFAFDLSRTAQQYFDDAKASLQGTASSLEQTFQGFGASASVQLDPVQALGYADALQQALAQRDVAARRDQLLADSARRRYDAARMAAEGTSDPVAREGLLAKAEEDYATALKDPGARAQLPALAESNAPAPASNDAGVSAPGDVFSSGKMSAFQGLRSPQPVSINARSALITAAGDKAAQSLFNLIGRKAEETERLTNAQVFVGLTMVSVNPGRLTASGYSAEVSAQADLNYLLAREESVRRFLGRKDVPPEIRRKVAEGMGVLSAEWVPAEVASAPTRSGATGLNLPPDLVSVELDGFPAGETARQVVDDNRVPNQKEPLIGLSVISPMNDGQTLDTASSRRRRTEFALGLALAFRAAGQEASANLIEKWARQSDSDSQTRANEITVNAFSSGNMFGYRVLPSYRAISDPGAKKPKGGYRLGHTSFPVVITMALERRGLRLAVVANPANGTFALAEPVVLFRVLPDWRPLAGTSGRGLGFQELMRGAEAISSASADLDEIADQRLRTLAELRLQQLKMNFNGSYSNRAFPVESLVWPEERPKPVRVQKSLPASVSLQKGADGKPVAADVDLVLFGENLDQVKLDLISLAPASAVLRGMPSLDGASITIPMTVKANEGAVVASLPAGTGSVPVVVPVSVKTAEAKQPFTVRVQSSSGGGTVEHAVTIPAEASVETVNSARLIIDSVQPKKN